MKTVNVATLKQQLSSYLQQVEQGDEVVVTSHRRPIARLIPEPADHLKIRPPTAPLSALAAVQGVSPVKRLSALAVLVADRGRR